MPVTSSKELGRLEKMGDLVSESLPLSPKKNADVFATQERKSVADSGIVVDRCLDEQRRQCLEMYSGWRETDQTAFVESLLARMSHHQHGQINAFLVPMMKRDFVGALPRKFNRGTPVSFSSLSPPVLSRLEKGLEHIAEHILSYLDAYSLCQAELVCREWYRVIQDGYLWKKLIEQKVRTDGVWKGLADRRGWYGKKGGPNSLGFYLCLGFFDLVVSMGTSGVKWLRVALGTLLTFLFRV